MKRILIFILILSFSLSSSNIVFAIKPIDQRIFSESPQNFYKGLGEGREMINNLKFQDVPLDFWAKESITRAGSLNMVKGYDVNFYPNENVSNQEAIAFVIRAIGMEQDAQDRATLLEAQNPDANLETKWATGYLDIAREIGIISDAEYADAKIANAGAIRVQSATREDIADWLVKGLLYINPTVFEETETQQNIYTYADWSQLSVDKVKSMELALKAGIIKGNEGKLNPKAPMTRAEMAQTLENMGEIHYNSVGIEKKIGTIGGIKDFEASTTQNANLRRDFYIRNQDGTIDVIEYEMSARENSYKGENVLDAVVFKDNNIFGLASLEQGDMVEYLVKPETGQVVYVQVLQDQLETKNVVGKLASIDAENALLTIGDIFEKKFTYPINEDLLGISSTPNNFGQYVIIDGKDVSINQLPIGSHVALTLSNGIISEISYLGEPKITQEEWGVVIENNPNLGYLTYLDKDNNAITKNYLENEIEIEKQKYYVTDDVIGGSDQFFQNFDYDPRDAKTQEIEIGDIIFMKFDPIDPNKITNIYSSPNYSQKHGKISDITDNGDYYSILFDNENNTSEWFYSPKNLPVFKNGTPVSISSIKIGEELKILVNESEDNSVKSVKEIVIKGDESSIEKIVKGEFAGLDETQNTLSIKNAYELTKEGWSNLKDVSIFSLSDKDTQYFQGDKEISKDYTQHFLIGNDTVYLAVSNNYAGDKVEKVSFRDGQDLLLPPDTIVSNNGNSSISILANPNIIPIDDGTIIRKNGQLVNRNVIENSDYGTISINGGTAGVIDITPPPVNNRFEIATGRISNIDEGKTFTLESLSLLNDVSWGYVGIEKKFEIDKDTLFLTNEGTIDHMGFKDFGETSYLHQVIYVVSEGTHAERVILTPPPNQTPFPQYALQGTIYQDEGDTQNESESENLIFLKDAKYRDENTGDWLPTNIENPIAVVKLSKDAIILKENDFITANKLLPGQKISILTEINPKNTDMAAPINGRIVLCE